MSLLPFVFGHEYYHPRHHHPHHRYWPNRLLDQDFGLAMTPDLLSAVVSPSVSSECYRPWRQLAAAAHDLGSSIKADKEKFQINLDVQHFAPEEISVRTADGHVVVEGRHEERSDEHGFVSRQFTRRYELPKGATPERVESRLSSDGVLTITAPLEATPSTGERAVPVARTGPVRREIKGDAEVIDTSAEGKDGNKEEHKKSNNEEQKKK